MRHTRSAVMLARLAQLADDRRALLVAALPALEDLARDETDG